DVANAITQVNLSAVAGPPKSVETLLQARVPGMTVDVGGATIGQGATIRLRGNVSLSQSNQPLVFVDGVRQTANNYPRNVSQGGSTFNAAQVEASPLADIDPGDVDRVEVVKGAAAATLYGTEAAAGVIEIFTKHGVLPHEHERRYSMRGNLTLQPLTNLTLQWNSFVSKNDLAMSPDGNSGESIVFNVYRSPVTALGAATPANIAKLLERTTTQTDDRLLVSANLHWVPFGWMSHKLTFGYDRAAMSGEVFHPYGFVFQPTGDISELDWRSETVTLDYAGSAEALLTDDFKATFSVGGQLVHPADAQVDGHGRGWPGPGKQTLTRAAERFAFSGGQEANTGGFFLQSLLALKDRYFLTGGLRVDGSSAFGSGFGLQAYPKLSASYVISDEPFWPATLGTAKLRAAYGFAGRAPGIFDAVRTWNAGAFAGQTAFLPGNLGNPGLGPERSGEVEVGLDAAAPDDRLSLTFTYYHRHTVNALVNVPQPASTGFGAQLENVGELSAAGIEASLAATLLPGSWFTWD